MYTLKEISNLAGVKYSTLINRLYSGMSIEDATEKQLYIKQTSRKYEYKGNLYSVTELMQFTDLSRFTVDKRLRSGWSVEDALTKPKHYRKEETEPQFKDDLDLEKMISNGMKRGNPYEPLETGLGKGVLKCKDL